MPNVAADLFEAHLGALAEEDREGEIDEWVASLLERNMAKVRQRVADLLDRTKSINRSFKTPLPTDNAGKKDVSEGGRGSGADTATTPHRPGVSFLEECPARPAIKSCKPEFEDHLQHGGSWHCHLVFAQATLGCGVGRKRDDAQKAALEEFFHLIGAETELLPFVERAVAARRALGDAHGGTTSNDPSESKDAAGGR